MWQFVKNTLSSALGSFLAMLLFFFFIVSAIAGLAFKFSGSAVPLSGNVLRINLNNPLVEHHEPNPLSELDLPFHLSVQKDGVLALCQAVYAAAKDNAIEGIYIRGNHIQAGFATVKELRNALAEFKKSGKWICFYADDMAENMLYLSSVGEAYVAPSGGVEFNGISTEITFFKNMLEKLDVDSKIYKAGKYKSAVEPFISDKMSEENRTQLTAMQQGIYTAILQDIATDKSISVEELRDISDNMTIRSAENAQTMGLINGLLYEDEVLELLNNKVGDENTKASFINWKDYVAVNLDFSSGKNTVAVLSAEGEIVSGKSKDGEELIGSASLIKEIRKLRNDDNVKAVVLRINSPGGSALASDLIWREIELLKKKKPVVASMSNVVASGGYYMAMACDEIVASPLTITGSIGVFGLMFNLEKMLNSKLGITTDRVKTGKYADVPSVTRSMQPEEDSIIQNEVNRIYHNFISKAAQARNTTPESIHEVAQGRVWCAEDAQQVGLIDHQGDLQTAVNRAAELANVADFKLDFYPKESSVFSQIGLQNPKANALISLDSDLEELFLKWHKVKNMQGYQMHTPYWITVK